MESFPTSPSPMAPASCFCNCASISWSLANSSRASSPESAIISSAVLPSTPNRACNFFLSAPAKGCSPSGNPLPPEPLSALPITDWRAPLKSPFSPPPAGPEPPETLVP